MTQKIPEFLPRQEIPDDIIEYPYALFRGLIEQELLERAIAVNARNLCERLFVKNDTIFAQPEWVINWETRSLTPEAAEIKEAGAGSPPSAAKLLMESPLGIKLQKKINPNTKLDGGRLRFQPADKVNHPLHQDMKFHSVPTFFTFWIPVIPPQLKTNKDTPGIEIFTFPVKEQLETEHPNSSDISEETLKAYSQSINIEGFISRPQMETGDVLMFRETVPHGSYIPKEVSYPKTSFDFRLELPIGVHHRL